MSSSASFPDTVPAPSSPQAARLDAAIDQALAEGRIVGAMVLVANEDRQVYRRAAGLIDREAGLPMPLDAIFRLSSVTKPIITLAALRLVEQGRLRLEDLLTRWLPDFRPELADGSTPNITVHQLLTHTAGLDSPGTQLADGPYHRLRISDGLDASGISLEEELRRLAAAPLVAAPGSRWRYSLSIDVLGAVVAVANASTLQQAVAELVAAPLQLHDTTFSVRPSPRVAVAYADDVGGDGRPQPRRMEDGTEVPLPGEVGYRLRFDPSRVFDAQAFPSGGAGMLSTADEVLRVLAALRGHGGLLAPDTVRQAFTDHVGTDAATQGLGWGFGYGGALLVDPALAGSPQGRGTLQWGGVYGHSWFIDRTNGWTVVALTNTALEGMSGDFPRAIRDAVYDVPAR